MQQSRPGLSAPTAATGLRRVIGVYSMIAHGITLAWLGALLGVSGAVAVGGIALVAGALVIAALIAPQTRRGLSA